MQSTEISLEATEQAGKRMEGKTETIQLSNYSTWKQKSVEISCSKSSTGPSLSKMPFIIITGRDQTIRPTLVGEPVPRTNARYLSADGKRVRSHFYSSSDGSDGPL